MANLIFQQSATPKKEYSLPKEAKEYAYYDFDDQRTLLDLPSKFQSELRGIKSSDPASYENIFEDVMEEWQYAVQDCLDPKKITEILENKCSLPRRQLDKFSKLKSNDSLIRRNKFYFPLASKKGKNLTQEVRKHIMDRHSSLKEIDVILTKAKKASGKFIYHPEAVKGKSPYIQFDGKFPIPLIARALEGLIAKDRILAGDKKPDFKEILTLIEKLNSFKWISIKSSRKIELPLRGISGDASYGIKQYIAQNLERKCYKSDGKFHITPVLIAIQQQNSSFKSITIEKIIAKNGDFIKDQKPLAGSLVYIGKEFESFNSSKLNGYVGKHLSGKNWVTLMPKHDSLEPTCMEKLKQLEKFSNKNGGSVFVDSYFRSDFRQYLMYRSRNLMDGNIFSDFKDGYETLNSHGIIWDHGLVSESKDGRE